MAKIYLRLNKYIFHYYYKKHYYFFFFLFKYYLYFQNNNLNNFEIFFLIYNSLLEIKFKKKIKKFNDKEIYYLLKVC